MIRKYCIYQNKTHQRLAICSIPVDDYHRSIEGTIAGGFINIDDENCEITLSGKSQDFGRPTIEQIVEAVKNNGNYLEEGDKEYTWIVVDMLGERVVINKLLQESKKIPTKNRNVGVTHKEYIDLTETNHIPVVRNEPKIGNNDICSCGSGKKYKKCCKK